jgi:genome maintenance exonuclease 1
MFNHVGMPRELPPLKSIQHEGKRFYLTPDGGIFPSMTTVLGELSKESIMEWRKRVGEAEANRISTQAARRGTNVHLMCEDYINNHDFYAKRRMPNEIEMFNSIKPILDERITDVVAQEVAMWSNYLSLAGRVDCIAKFDGKLSIIDFKTSAKPKKEEWITNYFMQEAGYAIMYEELTGQPITQLVTIIAVSGDEGVKEPQVFIEHRDNWAKGLVDAVKSYKEKYDYDQVAESIRHKFDDVIPGAIAV